jgi:hypothetical protein
MTSCFDFWPCWQEAASRALLVWVAGDVMPSVALAFADGAVVAYCSMISPSRSQPLTSKFVSALGEQSNSAERKNHMLREWGAQGPEWQRGEQASTE